jgi:hypothetical protein
VVHDVETLIDRGVSVIIGATTRDGLRDTDDQACRPDKGVQPTGTLPLPSRGRRNSRDMEGTATACDAECHAHHCCLLACAAGCICPDLL